MARTISADALDVIGAGASYTTTVTVTAPGEDPVDFEVEPGWSVKENAATAGTRLSVSSLKLLRSDSVDDVFEYAGKPGAVYDLSIGINLGSAVEQIQVFHGYGDEGESVRNSLGTGAALSDPWAWFDEVAFVKPFKAGIATRANLIEQIVTEVIDGLTVVTTADGSSICQTGVYTNTRGQAVQQLADDGLLSVGFNAGGDFIIKGRRDLDKNLTPDWHFRTGETIEFPTILLPGVYPEVYPEVYPYELSDAKATPPTPPATIIAGTLARTRPWREALVNRVTVVPGGDWQTWTAQTARLADENDPRFEDRVGVREITITSNTIGTAYYAFLLAKAELTRRLRVTAERVKFDVLLNPAVEADDVCFVSALPTLDDSGWNGTYIITSVTHAPSAGKTSIEAVSASAYNLGT